MNTREIRKWVLFLGLAAVGFCAFLVLIGEGDEMTFEEFLLYKSAAMVVLGLCLYIGKRAHRAGYLPAALDKDAQQEKEDKV